MSARPYLLFPDRESKRFSQVMPPELVTAGERQSRLAEYHNHFLNLIIIPRRLQNSLYVSKMPLPGDIQSTHDSKGLATLQRDRNCYQ